jgi:plastocyanin
MRFSRLLVLLCSGLIAACDPMADPGPIATSDPEAQPELLERITRPGDGGAVHLVRVVQRPDEYAFEPADLEIVSGDVVRFVMAGSQPESIAFDPVQASPEAADYIRSRMLHLGVLLTDAGQAYDVAFRDAPPGRYPFHSLPHGEQGMRGSVVIEAG